MRRLSWSSRSDRVTYRPSDADEDVLEVAHDVVRFAGAVRLLTADTGMRVRARSEGLDVLFVPKEWRRKTGDAGPPQAAPQSE